MVTAAAPTTFEQASRQATIASISELAGFLQEILSRRLTAYISGVKDGKTVTRWASKEVTEIRDHETEQRLRTAYAIAHLLLSRGDSASTVKAWFIGLNPQLGDISPAEAIHDGYLKEAMAAARAFIVGG
ncbi:MAG: XRE family transcriptional regulator [Chloroflexota bacterium]|nr:XRE family transcriptional regulator [Chloroflexota bacterium]